MKITLAYDGGAYAGWQVQQDQPTVQGSVETVLARLTGGPVRVTAAGRTDAGVHALGQVAGFSTASSMTAEELRRAMNALLPDDIWVVEAREVEGSFHARYQAEQKRYEYHLWLESPPPPFIRRYVWAIRRRFDQEKAGAGLRVILGRHAFAAFQAMGSGVRDAVRTVSRAEIHRRGKLITIVLEADGFLRHMARAIVGTLIDLDDPAEMSDILRSGDRSRAGRTAPPQGLFLTWVQYPGQGRPAFAPGPFDPLE